MLAAAIPLTYIYYMMQVADPLNMLVFLRAAVADSGGTRHLAAAADRRGHAEPRVAGGDPRFLCGHPLGAALARVGAATVATFLLAIVVYEGLRLAYGPRPYCCTDGPLERLVINFTDWRAYVDVLGVLNIALWGGWIGWRRRPQFLRRASLVIPVFICRTCCLARSGNRATTCRFWRF